MSKEGLAQVCKTANELFPDLQMRVSDLSSPTEAFLTKTLIHYLRAFGFRVDPPFNIDSEATDVSREKRLFLIKLCQQVERILQISFNDRTFRYYDIIKPTSKKTANMLDVLFNYWCYYKLYKKEVFTLVEERIKQREALCASVNTMKQENEKLKRAAEQVEEDISDSQKNIEKARSELQPAQVELRQQQKIVQQNKTDYEILEKQLSEISGQVNHLREQAVDDSKAVDLKSQIEKLNANIESCKAESAVQSQRLKELTAEIEAHQVLYKEIDAIVQPLPQALTEFKENAKLKERVEKQFATLEPQHKQMLLTHEKLKHAVEQADSELKTRKEQHDHESRTTLRAIEEQKTLIDQHTTKVDELEAENEALKKQIAGQDRVSQFLHEYVHELMDEH